MSDTVVLPAPLQSTPQSCLVFTPNVENVSRLAYAKWLSRCVSLGSAQQDWMQAEAELTIKSTVTAELADQITELVTRGLDTGRQIVAERAVGRILAASGSISDAMPKLVQVIGDCFGWEVGAVWLLDRVANLLRCVEFWHRPQIEVAAFEQATRLRTFSRGIGLPGRVWDSKSFACVPDVTVDPNFPRAPVALEDGLRGAVGFPICNGGEFIGVIEYFSRDIRQANVQVIEMMSSIGNQISQFIERQEAERQSLRREEAYRIAREIQQGFLPRTVPRLPGFEIAGRTAACDAVGGDFFDFIPFAQGGRDCLGFLVADASGHGIDSALLSAEVRAYLRGLSLKCDDLADLFELTNKCLRDELISGHFVTAFFMQLDAEGLSLTYTGAGHQPGHIIDARGHTRAVLPSIGLPLGVDRTSKFASSIVSLEPGDLILLNTDGITEMVSPDGELFGTERMLRIVKQHRRQIPDEILTSLFDAVGDFCDGMFHDDMTAVIVKVDGAVAAS